MEERKNCGVLFKNRNKVKDTHPDYTGNGVYEGVNFEISAWVKTSANGNQYLSMSFREPFKKEDAPSAPEPPKAPKAAAKPAPAPEASEEAKDDLPF